MWGSLPADNALRILVAGFGVFFGAATGSFTGVVLYRVPRGEGLGGRSGCVCGRQLSWYENIPLLSWLVLRGRARCCGSKIPAWFFGVELAAALWCAAWGAATGPAGVVLAALLWVAGSVLVARHLPSDADATR